MSAAVPMIYVEQKYMKEEVVNWIQQLYYYIYKILCLIAIC